MVRIVVAETLKTGDSESTRVLQLLALMVLPGECLSLSRCVGVFAGVAEETCHHRYPV